MFTTALSQSHSHLKSSPGEMQTQRQVAALQHSDQASSLGLRVRR